MSYAKVCLIGNLGRDPNLRYTTNSTAVCDFSLAVTERWKDRNGDQQERTNWWKVTVWGERAARVSEYLSKGKLVYVEGRPGLDEWTDREGNNRVTLSCNASEVQFLSPREENNRPRNEYDQRRPNTDDHDQRRYNDHKPAGQYYEEVTEAQQGIDISDEDVPF